MLAGAAGTWKVEVTHNYLELKIQIPLLPDCKSGRAQKIKKPPCHFDPAVAGEKSPKTNDYLLGRGIARHTLHTFP